MSFAIVYTRAMIGTEAPLVTVEAHISAGLPGLTLVGLPETAVKESRDRVRSALINGGFGHYSVVERALTFMDEIIIGIGINENKNTYFPIEKREEMIRNLYKDNPRIKVMSYDCLTIDFAQQVEAQFIVRGIRTVKDFEYEETIADT